jgi:anti-sigma regulatory factor (Ser/Thr protein kinase)
MVPSAMRSKELAVPDEASRDFGPDVASVAAARWFALETVDHWKIDARDVALVVGELAANAVQHGHTPFAVRLRCDRWLSIEVVDHGSAAVGRVSVSPEDQRGRGLQIVDRLALDWGVRPIPDGGKIVWARLEL